MIYPREFYESRHRETFYTAETFCKILLDEYPGINSVIDVGCGVGSFLLAFQKRGISDLRGLEGDWVQDDQWVMPRKAIEKCDLKNPAEQNRKYDLAISLEVAEHLPPESASRFVDFLCSLSDTILFSAAVPGQGGENHLNENWQSFWAELFQGQGFYPRDLIRPKIWKDELIYFWYRQNTLVYRKGAPTSQPMICDMIHPVLYKGKLKKPRKSFLQKIKQSLFS